MFGLEIVYYSTRLETTCRAGRHMLTLYNEVGLSQRSKSIADINMSLKPMPQDALNPQKNAISSCYKICTVWNMCHRMQKLQLAGIV